MRALSTASTLAGGGEMGALLRATDWAATTLGPTEAWPQSLRSAVSILLPSKAQIVLFWGEELIAIYNDAYAPVFGGKHPWALGRPARECWSEVWHVLGPLFERVVGTGEAFWAMEHPFFLQRQGFLEETYFDVSYDPVRIEDGSVGGIFCIVSDQTGRVLGARRLRTLRELGTRTGDAKSTEAVCHEAAGALAMDPADVPFSLLYLVDSSGLRARLVGTSGIGGDDLAFGGEVTVADVEPLALALVGRSAECETKVFLRRVGETAAERVLVLPISSGTQIVGALVAGVSRFLRLADDYRDFFDMVAGRISAAIANARAYEEERRRAEALAQLDLAKTRFFSNVSHEFRTPLTLLLGPLEEMLREARGLTSDEREQLNVVHRNALRLLKLVNTLLDFSRIEAGRIDAMYEPTDLATHIAEVASNFRSAVEKAGVRLVVDCPPLPQAVYVDRDMWEKIVLNLLSNAFKHTFEGEISVSVRARVGRAELVVRDTGVGIPALELPRLFERFHRVSSARSRTHEGTGIGLALVQELVRLHGGSIDAASEEGAGTTFSISVPFGTAHLPNERLVTRDLARRRLSTATGGTPYIEEVLRWQPKLEGEVVHGAASGESARRDSAAVAPSPADEVTAAAPRILIADDNADLREYVSRLIRAEGWRVETVPDGRAALAAARERPPDLVLSDVMMPELDGFSLLREFGRGSIGSRQCVVRTTVMRKRFAISRDRRRRRWAICGWRSDIRPPSN